MNVSTHMDNAQDTMYQACSKNYQCHHSCATTTICKSPACQLLLIIRHLHCLNGFSVPRVPRHDILLFHSYFFFAFSFSRVPHHRHVTSRGCPYVLQLRSIANTANNSVVVEPHGHDNVSGHTMYSRNVCCCPHGKHRPANKGFPFYSCMNSL